MSTSPERPGNPKTLQVGDISKLLKQVKEGDVAARDDFVNRVYDEILTLAKSTMKGWPLGQTLQRTALAHEVVMRLVVEKNGEHLNEIANRKQFFAAAATAMYRVLCEYARKRKTRHRDADRESSRMEEIETWFEGEGLPLAQLEGPLDALAAADPRKYESIVLRYFAGWSNQCIATEFGLSLPSVERDLRLARAFLRSEIDGPSTSARSPS